MNSVVSSVLWGKSIKPLEGIRCHPEFRHIAWIDLHSHQPILNNLWHLLDTELKSLYNLK